MKSLITILISIIFVQSALAQNRISNDPTTSVTIHDVSRSAGSTNYFSQVESTFKLQGETPVVPPQEGKTETDQVWVSRGIWIALIAIIIIVYLNRRKKPQQ